MPHTSQEEITVVAASLCNTFNGPFSWETMSKESQIIWRTRAIQFQREIVAHEWLLIAADELPSGVS